jgi:acyl-CoA synthetase (AMP-forming)/AMP-acid ligase II
MPNTEVFIVDEAGNELPANEVGELVIRGSNVMQGYWNDSATTAKVFQQGKYRGETLLYSGDLFRKDEEGYLYFVARKDDMIKTKGERVSPNEIEEVLYAMGGISKVAVFGISDHMFGQVIVACIVTKKDVKLSNQQVKKHCARNLEPFMVPQYIKFMNEFPISTSGKIDKKLIIENYMDNLKS